MESVLDISQLRDVTLDDEALMREVLRALLDDAAQRIHELTLAVEREDALACERLAHGAQGACLNVGAASLASVFRSLQQSAGKSEFGRCRSCLQILEVELERFRAEADAALIAGGSLNQQ